MVIGKAIGEEGLRSILQLIATRASKDEAFLLGQLGEGLKHNTETGKVDVNVNGLDFDVGNFYIDDDGHLIWDRDAAGGEGYIVVKKGEEIVYATDAEIQAIIDSIEL